jgi:carotenoid 1,2-hydratase
VFSPYYAWRRRRPGAAPAEQHNALNLSLYGRGGKRWAMTERGESSLQRSRDSLVIGPSALRWEGTRLAIDVDEWTAPWPTRLRGRIVVEPLALPDHVEPLDDAGRHRWCPIAPVARVDVDLVRPAWRFSGPAYVDSNFGDRPLADDFDRWDWSRAHLPGNRCAVLYDVQRRDGSERSLALRFGADGSVQRFAPPPTATLPLTRWSIGRRTRSDGGAGVERTLEDGPFYARSLLRARWLGEPVVAVHESLSLRRFESAWVQALLPFRMPRRG